MACAEELWIADELWRLARRQPADYEAFMRVCCRILAADGAEAVHRRRWESRGGPAREAGIPED